MDEVRMRPDHWLELQCFVFLQCFDVVAWVTGRISGVYKPVSKVLFWNVEDKNRGRVTGNWFAWIAAVQMENVIELFQYCCQ